MRSILFPRRKHFHIPDISDKVSSWKMDIIFLKFVCFFFFLNMVSPKEDCKFYRTKHDVFVGIERCDREIFLPKKIHSVKCPKHCENDPKVRIFYVIYSIHFNFFRAILSCWIRKRNKNTRKKYSSNGGHR